MIYITGDTHFSHQMLIDKGYRPADYEDKFRNAFSYLKISDILIHLGDFCIGNDEKNHNFFSHHIWAKRILVRGNHDKKPDTWYYKHGWDFVCDSFSLKKYGKILVFSHEPLRNFIGDINIHAHWHNNNHRWDDSFKEWYSDDKYKLYSPENMNYQPVSLRKFLKL